MDFCKHMDRFCIGYSRNNLLLADQKPRNLLEKGSRRDLVCWAAGDRTGGARECTLVRPCSCMLCCIPNIRVGQPERTVM